MNNLQWRRARLIIAAAIVYVFGFGWMWNHLPEPGPACDPQLPQVEYGPCDHEVRTREANRVVGSLLWPVVGPFLVAVHVTGGGDE